MRRQDHRGARRGARRQQILYVTRRGGIEPGQRLVQDQQSGIMDQRPGQHRLLPHATRKPAASFVPVLPQAEPLEQFARSHGGNLRIHAPEPGDEFEILQRCQQIVEQRFFRQPCHDLLGPDRIGPRIDAKDADLARIGLKQPSDHPQCRGLAGTVRPEQREELSRPHRQIETVHRNPAERLPKPRDPQSIVGHRGLSENVQATRDDARRMLKDSGVTMPRNLE